MFYRLRHVDIAILTEHDGEAVEVFGDKGGINSTGLLMPEIQAIWDMLAVCSSLVD